MSSARYNFCNPTACGELGSQGVLTVGEGIALRNRACGTRRTTQYGATPPYKECNTVTQALFLNPKGSHEMTACLRYGSLPGGHPAIVAVPCPATISYERHPLAH